MITVFIVTVVAFGAVALTFIFGRSAIAVTLVAIACFGLAPVFQAADGKPADPDGRLAGEEFRLLAVAPLAQDRFLVSVLYGEDDIRTYRIELKSNEAKERFLKAAGAMKKGRVMMGRAKRGRAGLIAADDMDFSFTEAPEAAPKGPSP